MNGDVPAESWAATAPAAGASSVTPTTPSGAPSAARPTARVWRWLGGLVVFAALLALGPDLPSLFEQLRRISPSPAVVALVSAGLAGSYLLRAARLLLELRRHGPAPFGECLRIQCLHNAALYVLPLRGGEIAYPLLVARRLAIAPPLAWASLAWLRLQDLVMLLCTGWLLFAPLSLAARLAAALAGLALAAAAVSALRRRASTVVADDGPPTGGWRLFVQALQRGPNHGLGGWLCTVGHWSMKLAVIAAALTMMGGVGAVDGWRGAAAGELAALWPLQGPAGLGTYEAGVWIGLRAGGAPFASDPSAQWVAAALWVHALLALAALVAGALAWPRRGLARRADDDGNATR